MSMNRHEPFEELISASLHGELTADERRRLDDHLDGCDQCLGTLADFAEQRRMVAGLRHFAPPRDLGARVRAGIERAVVPWWRKPTTVFTAVGGTLAIVAGALLALVVLNGTPSDPPVGQASPTPIVEPTPSSAPITLPEEATPPPTPDPDATPAASTPPAEPTPTPVQIAAQPEPDLVMAYQAPTPTNDVSSLTVVEVATGAVVEPDPPADPPDPTLMAGEPIGAELSPDGQWLAYVSRVGSSGMNQLFATRVAEGVPSDDPDALPPMDSPIEVGQTVSLGESIAGGPFLERLAWSSNSAYLHYTLAEPDSASTDVWRFDVAFGEPRQITDVGNAYSASWVPGSAGTSMFWISTAGETPMSYLHGIHDSAGDPDNPSLGGSLDPAESPMDVADHVFQPLLSPNGALAIYWEGRMAQVNDVWAFSEGGAPMLSEHRPLDQEAESAFPSERHLFSDLPVDREAFTSAAIAWGGDGDSYAVWDTVWTGLDHDPEEGTYPDPSRIYFGHATDARGLTIVHAIDEDDMPTGWIVEDVKVSPTGHHLVVMVAAPRSGQEAPTAQLRLITRNTGDVEDDVEILESAEGQWFGPAVFDAYVEVPGDGSGQEPAPSPGESGAP